MITIQSSFYKLVGIVNASAWEHSQLNDYIEVTTCDGRKLRTDEFLKKFWEIDPT